MTLADLEALRAALPDDDQLPASATQADLRRVQQQRADYDRRIRAAHEATAALASLHEPDPTWRAHLEAWRRLLCDELLTPVEHVTPKVRALRTNLTLSIRCIDFGPDVLAKTDYDLSTLRLGPLMRASGFEVQGADPARNYHGTMPWFGSLKEWERDERARTKRRAQAEAALADALLDDAERETQEADARALRDCYNAMRVKHSADPLAPGLVVVDRAGAIIDESTLTPLQQRALARARAMWHGEPVAP
jgi:hypothetical protein